MLLRYNSGLGSGDCLLRRETVHFPCSTDVFTAEGKLHRSKRNTILGIRRDLAFKDTPNKGLGILDHYEGVEALVLL